MKRIIRPLLLISLCLPVLSVQAVDTGRHSPQLSTLAEEELRTRAIEDLPHLNIDEAIQVLRARDALAEIESRHAILVNMLQRPLSDETLSPMEPCHHMPIFTNSERFVTKFYWAATEAMLAYYNLQNGHPPLPRASLVNLQDILRAAHHTITPFLQLPALNLAEMTALGRSPLGQSGYVIPVERLNSVLTQGTLDFISDALENLQTLLNPIAAHDFLRARMQEASHHKDWPALARRIQIIQRWRDHQAPTPFHPHNSIFFTAELAFYRAQVFIEETPLSLQDHPDATSLYARGAFMLRHVTTALTGLERIINRRDPAHPLVFNVPLETSIVPQTQIYLQRAQHRLQILLQSALPQTPEPLVSITTSIQTQPEEATTPNTEAGSPATIDSSPLTSVRAATPLSTTSSPVSPKRSPSSMLSHRSPNSSSRKRAAEPDELIDGQTVGGSPHSTHSSVAGEPPARRRRRLEFPPHA